MANQSIVSTSALVGLQGQLDTVRGEVLSTNLSLQNISSLIQRDSALDQQRLIEEREQEKLLSERQIRLGQQEELQQRISATIAKPVVQLENKLTSVFDRITNALKYLFTGFLGVQVLKGLKFSANLSLKALSGIGSFLRNSFGLITTGLSTLSSGFGSVIRSIVGVTTKVSNAILTLASSPFKALADTFKKFLPGVKPSAAAGVGSGSLPSAVNFLGLLTGVGGAISTVQNVKEGDIPGTILSGASIIPSPIQFPAAISSFAYETFTGGGIDTKKFFPKGMSSLPSFNFGDIGKNFSNMLNNFGINFNAPAQEVKGNIEEGNTSQAKPSSNLPKISTVAFSPQTPPLQRTNLKELPEPAPDLVYLQSGQQGQSTVASGESRIITDVPLIPSSNPDNFYTLYAQVNYNVVM